MSRTKTHPEIRFFNMVDATGDCWEWTGAMTNGYGLFTDGTRQGRAHRWSWEYLVGPIPDGLQIDHLCRNRRCVNPDHLEPVTAQTNRQRSPFYRKVTCVRGHLWTPATTIWKRRGGRACRTCKTLSRRKSSLV